LREAFPYLIKERGGLMAKGRLLGVQFEAVFTPGADGTTPYWEHAKNANAQAFRLRDQLVALGFEPYGDAPSNQQFFALEADVPQRFVDTAGCEVFEELPDGRLLTRFVCSWATTDDDVSELVEFARGL
jgi:threonine aldolase